MEKIKFKYGSHYCEHDCHNIRVVNNNTNNSYYPLEDVEITIDNDILELNAKQIEWKSFNSWEIYDEKLSSEYDLSEYKNLDEYTYLKTTGKFRNKKTSRFFNSCFLKKKERKNYYFKTNLKWTIYSDENLSEKE